MKQALRWLYIFGIWAFTSFLLLLPSFPQKKWWRHPEFSVLITIFVTWRNSPQWAKVSSLSSMITLRHATLDRAPLNEWSSRRRDLYMTKHNCYNRQTSMPPAGLEPTILASGRLQIYALDRAATGIGHHKICYITNINNNVQLFHWTDNERWLHRKCPYILRYHDNL
jgi:hypothetical protein